MRMLNLFSLLLFLVGQVPLRRFARYRGGYFYRIELTVYCWIPLSPFLHAWIFHLRNVAPTTMGFATMLPYDWHMRLHSSHYFRFITATLLINLGFWFEPVDYSGFQFASTEIIWFLFPSSVGGGTVLGHWVHKSQSIRTHSAWILAIVAFSRIPEWGIAPLGWLHLVSYLFAGSPHDVISWISLKITVCSNLHFQDSSLAEESSFAPSLHRVPTMFQNEALLSQLDMSVIPFLPLSSTISPHNAPHTGVLFLGRC